MFILKNKFFFTIIIFICFSGCDLALSGSKIKGKVVDSLTNLPLSNITVIATAKIDIEEDQKFASKTATTKENGEFIIKGLSSKYRYIIKTSKEGYTIAEALATPPENGQTRIIDETFRITKDPGEDGFYILSEGKIQKIQPKKFKKTQFSHPDRYRIKNPWTIYYIEKNSVEETNTQSNNKLFLSVRYNTNHHGYRPCEYIQPLTYFEKIKTCTKYTGYVNDPILYEFMNINEVYIAGVMSKKKYHINGFMGWKINYGNYENPSGISIGGFGHVTGKVPFQNYKISQTINLDIIEIYKLPSGYYALKNIFGENSFKNNESYFVIFKID